MSVAELQVRLSAREMTNWAGLWALRHEEQEKARKEAEMARRAKQAGSRRR